MKRFIRANSQSALLYFEAYQVDNIGELVADNLTHKYRSEGADFHYVSGKQGYDYEEGTNSITIRCRVSSHYDPEINKNSRYGAYLDSMDFKEFEATHTFRYNRYDTQDSMGRQLVIILTDDIEDQIFKAVNGDIKATTDPNASDACDKVTASTNDSDIVNTIYSVMMNYEYGYDPDMTDINSMLQELTNKGVHVDISDAFKKAWVSAHNKAERKTWGDSGDSYQYDSLTPGELEAIENYDTEYWEYVKDHPLNLKPASVTSSTKYTADMCSVGASDEGYEQLAEGDDAESEEYIEGGKYYVAGYLQSSYRGLMEDMYSDDFEEILTNAGDMAGQGLYVEITNRADGRSKRYTPEDFEEAASNGEYPDHIREDLAL